MKNSALDFLSNGIADYVLNPDKYVYPNPIFDSRENSFGVILTNNNIMFAKSLKTVVPDGVILAKYLKEAPRESNPYYPSMCVRASKTRNSTTFTLPDNDLPF